MLSKDNRTIFIVLPPFENEIHNVLYAKELFIEKLLKEGYSVIAIVFYDKHRSIIEEMIPNYQVICFNSSGFISAILSEIRYFLACKGASRLPFYMKMRWRGASRGDSFKEKLLKNAFFIIAGWLNEKNLFYIYRKIAVRLDISRLYKTYSPFLTILPFYYSSAKETEIIAVARNNNCMAVAIPARISAFNDVFYYTKPDLLLVWNEIMKQEALDWHGCNKNSVVPIGILKCDYYKDKDYLLQTQKEFIRSNNLLDDRRIISIICGNITVGRAYEIAKALFYSKQIKFKFQILLRANPDEFENQIKSLAKKEEVPVFFLRGFSSDIKKYKIRDQIISTANFLKSSDLIISAASTMCIESLYFNVPNIYLRYDEFNFYYEFDYIRSLLNERGLKFVKSDEELIDAVNEYLENPLLDSEQREKLFRKYCHSFDGNALANCFNEISKIVGYMEH